MRKGLPNSRETAQVFRGSFLLRKLLEEAGALFIVLSCNRKPAPVLCRLSLDGENLGKRALMLSPFEAVAKQRLNSSELFCPFVR